MQTCHKMHVAPEYFDLLQSGQKTVETRLLDEKRKLVTLGDTIEFFCQNDSGKSLVFVVGEIITARNFVMLFEMLPVSKLGGVSKQKQLSDLSVFYANKIDILPAIAFILEPHEKLKIHSD